MTAPQETRSHGLTDPGKQPLTVRCFKGSTFHLDVDAAETGWGVASRIAARIGHAAASLWLISGDCVLDMHNLLLQQAQGQEITYVVRKLGAGRRPCCDGFAASTGMGDFE